MCNALIQSQKLRKMSSAFITQLIIIHIESGQCFIIFQAFIEIFTTFVFEAVETQSKILKRSVNLHALWYLHQPQITDFISI